MLSGHANIGNENHVVDYGPMLLNLASAPQNEGRTKMSDDPRSTNTTKHSSTDTLYVDD
jgi:hypothetical protein